MEIINNKAALRSYIGSLKQQGLSIAFVPTMGNLHQGHLSLVRQAHRLADRVVVSVFVNPTQFDQAVDLQAYPRTESEDKQLLLDLSVDAVFFPSVEEMYASTEVSIQVGALGSELEGASRKGHFEGMATVVAKLFNLVQPDIAIFGQKDYQQLMIVRHMVEQLDFNIDIVAGDTIREADGLAMSSRNAYLTERERLKAPELYQTLLWVAEKLQQRQSCVGEMCLGLQASAKNRLEAAGFKPDYIEIRLQSNLQVPSSSVEVTCSALVVLGAAWLGRARLIDNISLSL